MHEHNDPDRVKNDKQGLKCNHKFCNFKNQNKKRENMMIHTCIAGHLSAVGKWGGKTSDYAKSGGAKPKVHGKHK